MSTSNTTASNVSTSSKKAESAPQVIFLGSPLQFSKRFLDTFHTEFNWIDFLQVSNLTDLSRLTSQGKSIALIVIEESRADALLNHSDAYFDAAGDGRIVVSYKDVAVASRVMAKRHQLPQLNDVGFMPLNVQMDVWLSVMHLLLCGEIFIPNELLYNEPQEASVDAQPCRNDANLTPREWEVLKLVAAGLQNKNIASDLSLSQHTIKLHIHNILKKIGVSNRTCAASWYNSALQEDRIEQVIKPEAKLNNGNSRR